MLKRVTIVDIARHAGLSKSTVAYAFHPRDYEKVSLVNRERVKAVAEALGYRANRAAKILRSGRSQTLGVLWPAPHSYYYASTLVSLQKLIFENGYMGSFSFWDSLESQRKATDLILSQQLDGIITVEPSLLPVNLKIPVVSYFNYDQRFDCVYHDFAFAIGSLFDYLLSLGHHRIAHISSSLEDQRSQHFLRLRQEFGLPFHDSWLYAAKGLNNFALGYQGMEQILQGSEFPSAIFAYDDQTALGSMRRAHEAGIRIPEELSLVGYGNNQTSSYLCPSLTTFDNAENVSCAHLLCDCLLHRINHPDSARRIHLLKPVLIKRESCVKVQKSPKNKPKECDLCSSPARN